MTSLHWVPRYKNHLSINSTVIKKKIKAVSDSLIFLEILLLWWSKQKFTEVPETSLEIKCWTIGAHLSRQIIYHKCFTSTSFPPHLFLLGWLKLNLALLLDQLTGLRRWTLAVAVISVDAYPFLAFSDLACHLEDTGIGFFWLHCATW